MSHLFVYGTLRPSCAPAALAPLLSRLALVAPASIPGRLHDLVSYPAAVFDATGASRIMGDVLKLPPDGKMLKQLDDYEGYDPASPSESLFIRQLQPAILAAGGELLCWVYLYPHDVTGTVIIPSGDYADWLSANHRTSDL